MSGLYNGIELPFIQQESNFWTSSLTDRLDFDFLARLRLAGDAYMWATFARRRDLGAVSAHLGGFRLHEGQLSSDLRRYREEMVEVCDKATRRQTLAAKAERYLWHAPLRVKKRLAGDPLKTWTGETWG